MSSNDSDEKKKNKFGTIGGAWAPTITTDVVKRIIDSEAFREDLKEKAKTLYNHLIMMNIERWRMKNHIWEVVLFHQLKKN